MGWYVGGDIVTSWWTDHGTKQYGACCLYTAKKRGNENFGLFLSLHHSSEKELWWRWWGYFLQINKSEIQTVDPSSCVD